MQNLWSRAAQLKSTCRCPSCFTPSKQGLSRQTITTATQLTRFQYGNRFAFYSTSILATAAVVDSFNKDKKKRELSRQIAEAKEELNARQAEQERRLEALGKKPYDLEDEHPTENHSVDDSWFDGIGDDGQYYDHYEPIHKKTAGHVQGEGPKRYQKIRKQYITSILKFYESDRLKFEPSLTDDRRSARDLMTSTGPLKSSPSAELDQHVKKLRDTYGRSRNLLSEHLDLDRREGMTEEHLGDLAYDLRILKLQENPEMDDQIEYLKTCHLEHRVHLDLYLQTLRKPIHSDAPCRPGASRDWCSFVAWAERQRAERERLGFQRVPGISLQELQAFTPAMLEEIIENDLIMDMVRGIASREVSQIAPHVEPLSGKKTAVMAMAAYKLVLGILHLSSERENARRHQRQQPPLPMERRQRLIDFWSYHTKALNDALWVEDEVAFPAPPLPVYQVPYHPDRQKYEDRLRELVEILTSQQSHEKKLNLVCLILMRSDFPLDIHAFNQILRYAFLRVDYNLVALLLQCQEESHLRPNEITVAQTLQYYRCSGQRQGFQRYVTRMYGRDGRLMVRDPMLMIPFLARSKFTLEKTIHGNSAPQDFLNCVELQGEPYRPFPTYQQQLPRIYQKAPRNEGVYSELIKGALAFGCVEDAFGYCVEMVRHGWKCTRTAFASLLKYCVDIRDWTAGFGIWEYKDIFSYGLDAEMYIQALRLCVVCGKRVAYQEILADGIRSQILDQGHSWPVTTLSAENVVSIRLSWAAGLETEMRNVTNALALEVNNVKRCIENAYGDTVLYPVEVQSQLVPDSKETDSRALATSTKSDDSVKRFEKENTTYRRLKNPVPKPSDISSRVLSRSLHKVLDETAAEQLREGATESQHNLEHNRKLELEHGELDWSYDYDSRLDCLENSMDSFTELENLLSWPAEPGYPNSQDMEKQGYVVVPAMHHGHSPIAIRGGLGRVDNTVNSPFEHMFPTFRSIQLDPINPEPPNASRTTTPDAVENIIGTKDTCDVLEKTTAVSKGEARIRERRKRRFKKFRERRREAKRQRSEEDSGFSLSSLESPSYLRSRIVKWSPIVTRCESTLRMRGLSKLPRHRPMTLHQMIREQISEESDRLALSSLESLESHSYPASLVIKRCREAVKVRRIHEMRKYPPGTFPQTTKAEEQRSKKASGFALTSSKSRFDLASLGVKISRLPSRIRKGYKIRKYGLILPPPKSSVEEPVLRILKFPMPCPMTLLQTKKVKERSEEATKSALAASESRSDLTNLDLKRYRLPSRIRKSHNLLSYHPITFLRSIKAKEQKIEKASGPSFISSESRSGLASPLVKRCRLASKTRPVTKKYPSALRMGPIVKRRRSALTIRKIQGFCKHRLITSLQTTKAEEQRSEEASESAFVSSESRSDLASPIVKRCRSGLRIRGVTNRYRSASRMSPVARRYQSTPTVQKIFEFRPSSDSISSNDKAQE